MHADNRKNDILILGEVPTYELDDAKITAQAKYSINITKLKKKKCLSLHYNGSNGFLHAHEVKIYRFKTKAFKNKIMSFVFRQFTIDNTK